MDPRARYLGSDVPVKYLVARACSSKKLISEAQANEIKASILKTGATVTWSEQLGHQLPVFELRHAGQRQWCPRSPGTSERMGRQQPADVKQPSTRAIQRPTSAKDGVEVSLADVIVLSGAAAIEKAAKAGGTTVKVATEPW